jgi:hypothetical protein
MALTPAQRQQNKRDREHGLPPTYAPEPRVPKELIEERFSQHNRDMIWATAQDAKNIFYKSECRKCVDLLAIYEGTNILNKEDEDEDDEPGDGEGKKKIVKKKKKENVPNPSVQKITIRAIEYSGILLEPNCDLEFRKMSEVDEVVSFQKWLDLRDKGRKNLFWLGRLAGKNLYHACHQMICDMFVKKNFDGMYFPGFDQDDLHNSMIAKQQRFANDGITPTRTMLLMAPRSGYKSTIDGLDAVQWMLNCPDIRVMLITAFRRLAKTFLSEIKNYFYLKQHAEPTMFQLLYPEYCLRGVDGKSKEPIVCPAATFSSKEPHLWITSMESSATGLRCDIRKADDIVDPKNSDNEELRIAFKYSFDGTNDLVEPWGFTDVVGTRYFTKDWYGTRMETDENGQLPAPYAYLWIPAWKPKPEFEMLYNTLLGTPDGMFQVKEDMVDLWFPQKLSFAFLRNTLKEKKERSFKNQQLNIATDPAELDVYINQFTLDALRAASYARSAAPDNVGMRVIQLWDVAYGERKTSDFSVGATIGVYLTEQKQEAVVVLEVVLGKWASSELPMQMVAFYEKYKALGIERVYIEDALGVKFLMDNIKNFCKIRGLDFSNNVRLLPMSLAANAKRNRIKNLEFLLGHKRLHFVTGAWLDEVFKQFIEYKGGKSTAYRKDDAPDCIGLATELMSTTAFVVNPDPNQIEKEHEERQKKAALTAMHNRMFGGPSPLAPKPAIPAPEPPPTDPRREAFRKMGRILPPGMRL